MTTEDNVPEEYVSAEEYARVRDDYWRVVRESEVSIFYHILLARVADYGLILVHF